jgi:anthranilate/para-aminobenzoate synthase component II
MIIIDSLSAPFAIFHVPGLTVQLQTEHEKANPKYQGGSSSKKRRKSYYVPDAKVEASWSIVRGLMTGLLKETLMAVTARNVAVTTLKFHPEYTQTTF